MSEHKNVTFARFNRNQRIIGEAIDLEKDDRVEEIISIVKFKDGSIDVFGTMSVSDICFGVKIIEKVFIDPCINSSIDGFD